MSEGRFVVRLRMARESTAEGGRRYTEAHSLRVVDRRRLGGWGGVVSTPASGGTPLAQPARTPAVRYGSSA